MCTRFSNVGTVAIFVGVENTRFDVHQDQLCKVSTFFKAAFTSDYKESSNKTMHLIEDDVDTVDLVIQWVYKQECNIGVVPIDDAGEMWMQPIRLLVFAEKYDIPSFKLDTIEILVAHIQEHGSITPSKTVAEYVYDNTCRGSGIRKLLADWYTTRNPRKWFQMRSTHDWLLNYPELAPNWRWTSCSPFRSFLTRNI